MIIWLKVKVIMQYQRDLRVRGFTRQINIFEVLFLQTPLRFVKEMFYMSN